MLRDIMMADVNLNLKSYNVIEPMKGRLVKAVLALMSMRRSHPAYTGECACAPCQIH